MRLKLTRPGTAASLMAANASYDVEIEYPPWFTAWLSTLAQLPPSITVLVMIWPQTVTFRWRFVGSQVWKTETGRLV